MQETYKQDLGKFFEAFQGKKREDIEPQMDARLEELKEVGHTLTMRFFNISSNQRCPCGSGLKFKRCHYLKLIEIKAPNDISREEVAAMAKRSR